jgi:hypothetical protein
MFGVTVGRGAMGSLRKGARACVAAVMLTLAVILASASPALARGPDWQPVPIEPVDLFVCGSTMHFEFPVNGEFARVMIRGGVETLQITGSLWLTITNPEVHPPTSITVNISGPSFSPTGEPVSSSRGHTIVILSPEDAKTYDLPEMFVSAGYLRVRYAEGHTIIEKFSGTVLVDLCAALS